MFFQQKTEKISRVKKIKSFFQDRYHLLFKGAAENHLRIQNALKNPDGTYQLTIKFDSYTDLKKYQKKLRRMTVSLSGALAMMIVAVIVAPYLTNPNKSAAAQFTWLQNKWTDANANPAATINHSNQSSATSYYQKDSDIATSGTSVTMVKPNPATAGDVTYDGSTVLTDTTNTYVYGGVMALFSLINGPCAVASNCKDSVNQGCYSGACKLNDGVSCTAGTASNCAANYCTSGTLKCGKIADNTAACSVTYPTDCISGYCRGIDLKCGKLADGSTCSASYVTDCISNNCYSGICKTPVNGACGGAVMACSSGTPINGIHYYSSGTWYDAWDCSGLYGGSSTYHQCGKW